MPLLHVYRFAHETGLKCLYPNLPGDLALVSNHRVSGENYGYSKGSDSVLLSHEAMRAACNQVELVAEGVRFDVPGVCRLSIQATASNRSTEDETIEAVDSTVATALGRMINIQLLWSFFYLPSLSVLAGHQYDLNLRRCGSLHDQKLFAYSVTDVEAVRGAMCAADSPVVSLKRGWTTWSDVGRYMSVLDANDEQHVEYMNCSGLSENGSSAHVTYFERLWLQHRESLTWPFLSNVSAPYTAGPRASISRAPLELYTALLELLERYLLPMTHFVYLGNSRFLPFALRHFRTFHTLLPVDGGSDYPSIQTLVRSLAGKTFTCLSPELKKPDGNAVIIIDLYELQSVLTDSLGGYIEQLVSLHFSTTPPAHLLVLGPCHSAPTDIFLRARPSSSVSWYTAVEDLCWESAFDYGGALYYFMRTYEVDETSVSSVEAGDDSGVPHVVSVDPAYQDWRRDRVAVGRRLQHGLDSQRMVQRKSQETFA